METFTDTTLDQQKTNPAPAKKPVAKTKPKPKAPIKVESFPADDQAEVAPEVMSEPVQQKKPQGIRAWRLEVSGSYRTQVATDKNRGTFEKVVGFLPYCDEEVYITTKFHPMRMFPVWQNENGIRGPYEGTIKLHVDKWEETTHVFEFIGKGIKQMSWEDLQYLACYHDLRAIPFYKAGDLRTAREKAYLEYVKKVMKKRIFESQKDLDSFRAEMREKGRFDEEINSLVEDSFRTIVDPKDPNNSYNFGKLPDIVVK